MDIKEIMSGMFVDGEFSLEGFIAAITAIVKAILSYVAGEEGYAYPAE